MVQQINSNLWCWHTQSAVTHVLTAPLPIQPLDWSEALSSWLWPGSTLASVTIWGVNQRIIICPSISNCLFNFDFQIKE